MKKLLLALAVFSVVLSSCRTTEQAAQRHIRKAISLDPDIISKQTVDTLIKGIAKGIIPVITPEKKGQISFDCDSIQKAFEKLKQSNKTGVVSVGSDKNLDLSVGKDEKGKMYAQYTVKPDTVFVPVEVPYETKITVPGKAIKVPVDRPFYVYKWFWILLGFSLLMTYLWLNSAGVVTKVVRKIKDLKNR